MDRLQELLNEEMESRGWGVWSDTQSDRYKNALANAERRAQDRLAKEQVANSEEIRKSTADLINRRNKTDDFKQYMGEKTDYLARNKEAPYVPDWLNDPTLGTNIQPDNSKSTSLVEPVLDKKVSNFSGLSNKDISKPKVDEMNPMVKEYIAKKFNLGEYSDENRKKLLDENSGYDLLGNASAALAALGAGFSGRDAGAAGNSVLARNKASKDDKLAQFDKGRANKIQEWSLDREATKAQREDEQLLREQDPTSQESIMAQQLAKKMGFQGDASKLTAGLS